MSRFPSRSQFGRIEVSSLPRPSTSPIFPPHARTKKPGRPTRGKAPRPELQPLDEHLAALLNPALVEAKQGFGEAPQPKFESAAPDSHPHGLSGAPASAESLKALLELGDPNIRSRPPWTPHRPPRPDKSEGERKFRSVSDYAPGGDQPQAIAELVKGVEAQERDQVLLGFVAYPSQSAKFAPARLEGFGDSAAEDPVWFRTGARGIWRRRIGSAGWRDPRRR